MAGVAWFAGAMKKKKIPGKIFGVVFFVLGGLGVLPLWLAVFADVGVMLIAVLNSMRMRLHPCVKSHRISP